MRLLDLIRFSAESLERAGMDDPLTEAEILVTHAAGVDRLTAYVDNPDVGSALSSRVRRCLARRAKGIPLQYIIGDVDFLGLTVKVGRGVLIPRPETELLATAAMEQLKSRTSKTETKGKNEAPKILDLCTGSGCVALALAREFTEAEVVAVDISKTALRYSRENAKANGIANVTFLRGSLFHPAKGRLFDLIVSNPPYIRTSDIEGLQREIRDWEPRRALDGGEDGLDFYREIFSEAPKHLEKDGTVMLEMGFNQAEEVIVIAEKSGFGKVATIRDLAGIERIVKAERD